MAAENVKTFTDANFEAAVLQSPTPVVVDFWASWCGPCVRLAPTIDALAADYGDRVSVGKLNVDENMQTAARFGIMSIPAVLVFDKGQVVEQLVGLRPKEDFVRVLDGQLGRR